MSQPALVVLTPVKNEAWILERFLAVATRCADLVIVADQDSTDGSPAICRKFANVVVVRNASGHYDESARQRLLIDEARQRVAGRRVLLALDADEIIAADAPTRPGWKTMLAAAPGTVLRFEKIDLYQTAAQCIRYATPWPLGYVDDGALHRGRLVHSVRIPTPPGAPELVLPDVKIIHCALARPRAQQAKMRLYSVIEKTSGRAPWFVTRRRSYSSRRHYPGAGTLAPAEPAWLGGWAAEGIDLRSLPDEGYHWQDFEVLRHFARYGSRPYWWDDIWDFDWEACRRAALAGGHLETPLHPIFPPPPAVLMASRIADGLLARWKGGALFRPSNGRGGA
jgi:glycosyltransferase involved in cell wall biosynthesis